MVDSLGFNTVGLETPKVKCDNTIKTFWPAQTATSQTNTLERTPQNDVVNISNKKANNEETVSWKFLEMFQKSYEYSKPNWFSGHYTMTSKHFNSDECYEITDKLSGTRNVKGHLFKKDVDLDIKTQKAAWLGIPSGSVKGTFNGEQLDIKFEYDKKTDSLKLKGNLPKEDFLPTLSLLIGDTLYDALKANAAANAACC